MIYLCFALSFILSTSTKINPSIQSPKLLSILKLKNLTPPSSVISLYCLYKVGTVTLIFAKADFKNLKSFLLSSKSKSSFISLILFEY